MTEYIKREDVRDIIAEVYGRSCSESVEMACIEINNRVKDIPMQNVIPIPATGIGDVSDGYHTFNALYYQRMVLFAVLVKTYRSLAWKSYRHEEGELCFGGGWFIVGINTPEGAYTYHYENEHWDVFDCEELPQAPHWDGHTERDVTRLLSLATKKTNFDKLRRSSVNELATFLGEHANCPDGYFKGDYRCVQVEHCRHCWWDWLTEDAT